MFTSFSDVFGPKTDEDKVKEKEKLRAWYDKGVTEKRCAYCKHVIWVDELEHGYETAYPWCGLDWHYVGGDKGKNCFDAKEFSHA